RRMPRFELQHRSAVCGPAACLETERHNHADDAASELSIAESYASRIGNASVKPDTVGGVAEDFFRVRCEPKRREKIAGAEIRDCLADHPHHVARLVQPVGKSEAVRCD